MSLWDFLFASNYEQHRDIVDLEAELSGDPDLGTLKESVRSLAHRVDELELLLSALVKLLEIKGPVRADEIRLMIERIDLADGVADGKMGPDRTEGAPVCPHCSRPANANRDKCVYCGRSLEGAAPPEQTAQAGQTISCSLCQRVVPERSAFFTEHGLVCGTCYPE